MENVGDLSPHTFALGHARPKPSFLGCSRLSDYELLGKLGEGTFGEVHRARSRKTGALVALKKIIMHNEKDGFPITALREIKLLKLLSHKNVLRLEDMAMEHPPRTNDKRKRPNIYMVTPYMDHDLSGLLDNPSVTFSEPQIKCYMMQLLEGLRYLHDSHILHRDMKAANLLINNRGILQIADFGLARHYDGPTPQSGNGCGDGKREYTGLVVTRWYRPPELLLHLKRYTPAIDIWGVGCVFGEMLIGKPILAGESDGHQLELIWDMVGAPSEEVMPGWRDLPGAENLSPRSRPGALATKFRQYGTGAVSLLKDLLRLDWRARMNAQDALQHSYFKMEPLPARPGDLPTFEESHEFDRRKFHDRKAGPPPAPKGGTVGMGPDANGAMVGLSSGDAYTTGRNGNGRYHPPPPPPYRNGNEERRAAWHLDRGLPPKPPPPSDKPASLSGRDDHDRFRDRDRDRDRERDRDRDRERDRDRDRDWDRDRRPASRAGGPRGGDVDTYIPSYTRDARDAPSRHRDDKPSREDRRPPTRDDRDRRDRDGRDRRTRSRSRSPVRERRDRDRGERDAYRR